MATPIASGSRRRWPAPTARCLSLREQGAVRAIGAGLNEWEACQEFAEAGDFDCFLLAGRYTLLDQTSLDSFLPLCERRGIGIILGGPYNSGILATGAVPGAFYDYAPASPAILERTRAIEAICLRHAVPLRAAALQFPLSHPAITTVIPGARDVAEVEENLRLMTHPIPYALWLELRQAGLIDAMLSMIDAHVHYWRVDRGDYDWLTPDQPIYRDFLPPTPRRCSRRPGSTASCWCRRPRPRRKRVSCCPWARPTRGCAAWSAGST